jgi:aryl-alcohol dehydrogenase-like predicted oxidoreductase
MEKRKLGKTDLMVCPLGYGAMELRGMQPQEIPSLLHGVLDLGINYIDTSPDYKGSEEAIGASLSGRRSEYLLATKCGCNLSGSSAGHIFTAAQLRWNLEDSLRKLRTDHLDVWQLHCITLADFANGAQDEILGEMQRAKQAGKVRYIGASFRNGSMGAPSYPAQECFENLEDFSRMGAFDLLQTVYGGLTRQNERLIAQAAARGVVMVARGVLNRYYADYEQKAAQAGLAELFEDGETLNDFLIRFVLTNPDIGVMIVGSRSVEHMAQNFRAAQRGPLGAEVYAAACERLAAIGSAPDLARSHPDFKKTPRPFAGRGGFSGVDSIVVILRA